MLFGWKSPRHMYRGLGRSVLLEAQKFYHDYLDTILPSTEDDEDEESGDPPWEAESITGEMT